MKGYETWSFRDRSFLAGLAVSLVWHFFWFFTVAITVSPEKAKARPMPRVVSLGRALDDSFFKTLLETRPQLSEAFYRRAADLEPALRPPPRAIERHAPGDVVSVPFGRRFLDSMKVLLAGDKVAPEEDFASKIAIPYADGAPEVDGPAASRRLLQRPDPPPAPTARIEVRFTVDAGGSVPSAQIAVSSGDPLVDDAFVRHVRKWQFEPERLSVPGAGQSGIARFGPGTAEEPA